MLGTYRTIVLREPMTMRKRMRLMTKDRWFKSSPRNHEETKG
jgi:hypothetical protein